MRFLRTASTRRLLAALAGLVVAIAAGSAIAVAAGSGGKVPKSQSLADAIHQGLAAPKVQGIFARIKFTNKLISASNLQGSDPILSGATGRLWMTGDHQLRLALDPSGDGNNGQEAQLVVNGSSFWVYDPMANTVYEGTIPSQGAKKPETGQDKLPSVAQIQAQLNQVMAHVNLKGPTPRNIAGQEAYTVKVTPKHAGGLLGAVQVGWDALRGVPLRVGLYPRHSKTPVLELTATDITYGAISPSDLNAAPPTGAKVVKVATPASKSGTAQASKKKHPDVTGAAAVQKHLSFRLAAPKSLVGLPRQSVKLLDWGGKSAALVSYGQNLGGIAVIEQAPSASSAAAKPSSSGDRHGLSLPAVSINGTSAQELGTAIGTVLRVNRDGVAFTVLGSVQPVAAEQAARQLAP
jgi:outer membrane lipoprotein-sorting protein